jgi:hypothetical protein
MIYLNVNENDHGAPEACPCYSLCSQSSGQLKSIKFYSITDSFRRVWEPVSLNCIHCIFSVFLILEIYKRNLLPMRISIICILIFVLGDPNLDKSVKVLENSF